jgi:predicted transcriptional regulator
MPREDWSKLEARDCMRPVDNSMFISARLSVPAAHTVLANNKAGRAVVINSNDIIVGRISLNDIRKAQSVAKG